MHRKIVHEETQDVINVSIANDGGKNTVFLVTGVIKNENDSVFDIIDTSRLSGNPTNIRLDSTVFMIESGLKVFITYRNQPYVLPLEGRSKIDLGWVGGITGHEVDLIFKGTGSFFIVLDVSKMGV
ncbi:hypothetical protein UFOVP251_49 [uncultured Caudovirales phage]|uniref:Uncharacterized protein n=1 Tax=uncultured Caudovirales phage TaxID=2100421 RepID=A0A6J5LHD8_9CAUD|nr:hypothetical protein UFOVP251_49 [uncultured Caudovirales phage]